MENVTKLSIIEFSELGVLVIADLKKFGNGRFNEPNIIAKSGNLTFDAPHHTLRMMSAKSNCPMVWPICLPS